MDSFIGRLDSSNGCGLVSGFLETDSRSESSGSGKRLGFEESGRRVGREVSGRQDNGRVDREGDSLLSRSGGVGNVSVAHGVACDEVGNEGEGLSGGLCRGSGFGFCGGVLRERGS